jgi:hypothetical protein
MTRGCGRRAARWFGGRTSALGSRARSPKLVDCLEALTDDDLAGDPKNADPFVQ